MPDQSGAQPLTNHVTRALAELRGESASFAGELTSGEREDMDRLFSAGAALDALLADRKLDEQTRHHDMLNVLGAMRGYAEMLLDDLGPRLPAMEGVLQRVLKSIAAATDGVQPTDARSRELASVPSDLTGTILAVDDNADNRELLTRYLQRSGHQVIVAASGTEALSRLADRHVDVVLLDLIMPGMDGGQVLRRLKESSELRSIPVIVISGRQDMEGIIDCIEAGADDYLFKPFNPVLLQARIKAGLERKRWHDKEEKYRRQLERNEKFIRATFGRYVSDEIVENLLEEPEGLKLGGDLRQVTMLMSDIRQFSTLCEGLPPEQVMRMLNNYLGVMTDIILKHQGTIDEFIGDAILAIFGAPVQRDDDADRAVQCALDMQHAMLQINRDNRRAGLPEITMGIGVNTGDVITGNIGSEKRSKYGVVGHHVNLTARIESQTAGGDILISDSTLQALALPVTMGESQQVQVKGINEPVTMHRVLDTRLSQSHVS
ncbi:MAG: adenylate/guanylate cyclase domain-containing protein [Halieaceae bacterium]|nr:adenylate/guanylate cyclase domain-containing protein [Halieaceae bacterium]